MSGAGAPPPQGPDPVAVLRALRAMSALMAEGAEAARFGEKSIADLVKLAESTPGVVADPALGREAVGLGLLAGALESVSGLASVMALLLVEIEAVRNQQAAILQRLGPRIILPGEGHG